MGQVLPQNFYFHDTTEVARSLLGKTLCHRTSRGAILKGRIVETEAYLGLEDPACHTYGGRKTPRVTSMYLRGGHSYIYMIYGMHFCLNVVTRSEKDPEAVLVRALEPILGEDPENNTITTSKAKLETNGPGKLCRYLGLNKKQDGLKLWRRTSELWIEDAKPVQVEMIIARPRVGVDYAGEAAAWPLRFYLKDNRYISKK